jgi:hypothetical protein
MVIGAATEVLRDPGHRPPAGWKDGYCDQAWIIPDGTLDTLPLPARVGRIRIGGID